MIPRKFLFHTMSAVLLTFALSTAGYAAEPSITEQVYSTSSEVSIDVSKTSDQNNDVTTSDISEKNESTQIDEAPSDTTQTDTIETDTAETDTAQTDPTIEDTETPKDAITEISDAEKPDVQQIELIQAPKVTESKTCKIVKNTDTKVPEVQAAKTKATETKAVQTKKAKTSKKAAVSKAAKKTKHVKTKAETKTNSSIDQSKVTIVDAVTAPTPLEAPVKGVSVFTYTVKKGDTLYLIAKKYGTTASAIKSSNNLKSDALFVGQTLKIPGNSSGSTTTYTVKKGDTLYLLSKRYNTTITAIKTTNNLNSNWLYVGQVLKIPGYLMSTASTKTNTSTNTTIVVQPGDTLFLLSRRYGTSVAAIKSTNGLTSDALYVGQKLKISSGGTQTASVNRTTTTTSSRYDASRSEVMLLARLIYGESRGESYEGQVAVGAVVLNRVKSSLFPNTIYEVIYQRNEFSVVLDGQINLTPDTTAIKAAEAALGGYDPTGGALFYWNPVKAPNNAFLNAKPIITTIGSHVFAK